MPVRWPDRKRANIYLIFMGYLMSTRLLHSYPDLRDHHQVDWAVPLVLVLIACTVWWWMMSHPGSLMTSLLQWCCHWTTDRWHPGYLMTSQKPPPSHLETLTDATVTTVTMAAGQDMQHRLCRPPCRPRPCKVCTWRIWTSDWYRSESWDWRFPKCQSIPSDWLGRESQSWI